jgi:peptidoglycan/xylan/chitin deacetylase (PgdA/CDA1 family)
VRLTLAANVSSRRVTGSAETARLHALAGPWGDVEPTGSLRPLVSSLPRVVARVSGPEELIQDAGSGLPQGAAWAEAVAVRLRQRGVKLGWGEPQVLPWRELLDVCEARGRSSVALMRADPGLVPELQVGSWLHATTTGRAVRGALARIRPSRALIARGGPRAIRWALDAAFWRGVRLASTDPEWRRLTRSYVALAYHRLAGENKPGQERLDLPPEAFHRQMRVLRLLRFKPLGEDEVVRLVEDPAATPPRRAYVVTVDDGFADCIEPLAAQRAARPQLFVPTAEVGGTAWWAGGEPVATWQRLEWLERAGTRIGSHTRHHAKLPELDAAELHEELDGSRAELDERVARPLTILSYPHGKHDLAVRSAARAAGYRAAWTTEPGRNGAGTDPFCLRRIGIKASDGLPAFMWKVLTGELVR